jgi:hypothetical protein
MIGLRERRERRREKRAILQGISSDRNRDASLERAKHKKHAKEVEKVVSTRNEKKKTTKSSKVPLGIALMESFTAKNAKKDRLTVSCFLVCSNASASANRCLLAVETKWGYWRIQ